MGPARSISRSRSLSAQRPADSDDETVPRKGESDLPPANVQAILIWAQHSHVAFMSANFFFYFISLFLYFPVSAPEERR